MTRSDIIMKLADEYHLAPRHARLIVDSFFSNIIDGLTRGDKIILRGFGTFSVKVAKSRLSRNPQTGEEIQVGERRSLVFKAGRSLHNRLNKSDKK